MATQMAKKNGMKIVLQQSCPSLKLGTLYEWGH